MKNSTFLNGNLCKRRSRRRFRRKLLKRKNHAGAAAIRECRDVFDFRCMMAFLYGNGTGTFQNPQYFTAGFDLRGLAVADLNGDGKPDIVTADEIFDEVAVLLRQ